MEIQLKQFRKGKPLLLVENQHLSQIINALQQAQAYEEVVQVAQQMSEGAEKYLLATNALLHLKRWQQLIDYCHAGLRHAEEPEFHYLVGKAHLKTGKTSDSIAPLRRAVELAPANPQFHRELGGAYYQLRRYEEAANEQERAAQLEPENATHLHNLGSSLFRLGRHAQAEAAFSAALARNPAQPLSHSWRGDCLRCLGRLQEALEAYSKAYELSGNPVYLRERDKMLDLLHRP